MRRVAGLLLALTVSACANTATIVTRDGRRTEALIAGGDRDHLLLQSPYGVESAVRRAEVRDIDHPGNVLATVGGVLAGSTGLDLVVLGAMCSSGRTSSSGCPMLLGMMGGMAAVGTGLFVWGLWTWLTSKNAVTDSLASPSLPESLTLPAAAPQPPAAAPPLPLTPAPVPGL